MRWPKKATWSGSPRNTGACGSALLSEQLSGMCKVHKGSRSSGEPPPCRAWPRCSCWAAAVPSSTATLQPAVPACQTAAPYSGWWWPGRAGHWHLPAAAGWSPPPQHSPPSRPRWVAAARGPGPSGGGRVEGNNPFSSNALASPTHSCELEDSPATPVHQTPFAEVAWISQKAV